MVSICAYIQSRTTGDTGATMVEYALIVVTIAIVAVVGAMFLGPITSDKYVDVGQCVDAVANC